MSSTRSKLTIDLDAIAHNWKLHAKQVSPSLCSAVVKADAYGLGVSAVSARLYAEGCRDFYVASLQEARQLKPNLGGDAVIYVLSGVFPGEEYECVTSGFVPVLVSMEMLQRWVQLPGDVKKRAALKIDTGMGRLGLSHEELLEVIHSNLLAPAGVEWVLSHLACADQPGNRLNLDQLSRFKQARALLDKSFPGLKYSLANSAGCALGSDYHFDMVRPGIALYGSKVAGPLIDDLKPVVGLSLEVIQVRELPAGAPVGYGATSCVNSSRLIAVAAGGYADGISRSLSNRGKGFVAGRVVPIAGRISMDTTMFDVTSVSSAFQGGARPSVVLLGVSQGVDELASDAGTVGYEVLTSLGERFERVYLNGFGPGPALKGLQE